MCSTVSSTAQNKYSGIEISYISIESIFPTFVNIRTFILADSRSKFIGIVGETSYSWADLWQSESHNLVNF